MKELSGAAIESMDDHSDETIQLDYCGFIGAEDSRWGDFLTTVDHDFYHLPEYVALAAEHENGFPLAFYAEDQDSAFLLPLLRRSMPDFLEVPEYLCDLITPYGYSSPLCRHGKYPESFNRFLATFRQAAREINAVSGFIRFHPLLPCPLSEVKSAGTVVCHGKTVVIDLTVPSEITWKKTRENHRDDIRKAQRAGFTAVMDDWRYWEDFIAVYHDTMRRIQAHEWYCFSRDYFEEMRRILGERLHLCTVFSPDGQVAASGLITAVGDIAEFHLAATASEFMHWAPSKLMFNAVRHWAQERGLVHLHLGGGVGGRNDNLYRFKSGFSKKRLDFHTGRIIFDQQMYDKLVRRWMVKNAETAMAEDYFPAYRQGRST